MQPTWVFAAAVASLLPAPVSLRDEVRIKFAECPAAVRAAFHAEAKDAKIEMVTREKDEDETIYGADVPVGGRTYAIRILEDGTLSEMNLTLDEGSMALDRCPPVVQETFKREAFGEKVEGVELDKKYGMTIYEAVVMYKGKPYEIVVAEDGTLVEKVLVVDDEEIELAKCPAAVQAAFHEQSKGGKIRDITRSTGIGRPTYEAEVGIKEKVYLVEIDETGALISKSLEAVPVPD